MLNAILIEPYQIGAIIGVLITLAIIIIVDCCNMKSTYNRMVHDHDEERVYTFSWKYYVKQWKVRALTMIVISICFILFIVFIL